MSSLAPPVGPADHAHGPADAPVTLVEYGDYECPHCGLAHPIVKAVESRLGDRLRFVFRHFPISSNHPHAQHAAEMAEAAAERGKFWEMHDLLYGNQDALEDEDLLGYAGSLGIDSGLGRVGAAVRDLRRARARELPERGAQRGERHADLLHQRRPPRRPVGRGVAARGDRGRCRHRSAVTAAVQGSAPHHPHF